MTTALAVPGQSAGLLAAIFTVSYLALSVPALIAGIATTTYGLGATALVYSASLAVLVAVTVGTLLSSPQTAPTRPAHAGPAVMPPGPCTAAPCPQAIESNGRLAASGTVRR